MKKEILKFYYSQVNRLFKKSDKKYHPYDNFYDNYDLIDKNALWRWSQCH